MIKKLIVLLMLSSSCYALNWECVETSSGGCRLKRFPVVNGWILKYQGFQEYSITFVPDTQHIWKL